MGCTSPKKRIMNIKKSRILATLLTAATLAFTPSCEVLEVAVADGSLMYLIDEILAGTTTENGEMYDSAGNPIYGYDGNNAVYGYNQSGIPIYNVSDLTNTCVVPVWAPRPTAAPRPFGVRMAPPPIHVRHKHGPVLKKPGEKFHRRPTREERRRMHEEKRMRPDRPGRPDKYGRPDKHGMRPDKHGMRPDKHGMRPDRPGMRPDRPGMRPGRPGKPDRRADKPGRPDKRADRPGRPDKRADRPAPPAKPDKMRDKP